MAPLVDPLTLFLSMTGGILPAVLWLWFWLREDNKHPEPPRLIVITFLLGIFGIIPTFFGESYFANLINNPVLMLTVWAFIEEVSKLTAAYLGGLHTKEFDEPMDAIIYMMTAALGFSAAENFLFIINSPFLQKMLLTGGMRFVGASLLHVLASSVVGATLALTFNRGYFSKILAVIMGIFTATALHTTFNVFILNSNGNSIFGVFLSLWLAIIFLILFFEKLKSEDSYNK